MKKLFGLLLVALLMAGSASAQIKFTSIADKPVTKAGTLYTDFLNHASCTDSLGALVVTTDSMKARVFWVAYPYPVGNITSIAVPGTVVDTINFADGAVTNRYAVAIGTNPILVGYYAVGLKVIVDSVDVVPTGRLKSWLSGY